MEADGRIVIDTAIDTDGFTAGSKELEAAAKRAASNLDNIGAKAQINLQKALDAFSKQNEAYRSQQQRVEALKNQLKEMEGQKVETPEYKQVIHDIGNLEQALEKAEAKQKRFLQGGSYKDKYSQGYRRLEFDTKRISTELTAAKKARDELQTMGAAYISPDTSGVTSKLTAEQAKLEGMNSRLNTSYAALNQKIEEYKSDTQEAAKAGISAGQSMGKLNGHAQQTESRIKKAGSAFKNFSNISRKSGKTTTLGAKGMAMLGLGVSSLLGALSQLRQGMVEGLQNLSKFDKGTNASLSSMKSSLSQVKNSLATAFSPILTAIAPAINTLLGLISKALNAIREFVAALTGQNTFTRATTVQENFAESLGGTASAAKEAQKQMSGLDEMTTWQSKSSGGGGGGGGGGSGAGAFETVDITNSPIANFANQIKDMIAKQDFRGVGDLVAQKMNAAIGAWDGAGAGKKLSDGIKSALDTAIGFLQGTDWQNMGRQVANFITAIDWSGITNRLFEGLGSVLGGLAGFIWGLISGAWANVVTWWSATAGEDGKMTIGELLNGIWEGIKNIGKWIYDNIFQPFVDGFCKAFGIHSPSTVLYDLGLNIVQGLINAVKSIPQKAKQIFESARNSIKTVLNSISSFLGTTFKTDWSKKLGALGDPLNALLTNIQNVWNGIKTTFNGIITFVKGVFTGDWKKAWSGVKTAFSGVFATLKSVAKAPLNSIVGLINGLITALNSMIRGLNKIKVNIPSWVPGLGGKSIGFNIPQISKVPYLATGAVIPPNAPFTAVLGDQRHGTNLEAPESLIRQIVREESGRGGGSWTFTAQINRRTLFREMIEEAKLQQARTGKDPFALA